MLGQKDINVIKTLLPDVTIQELLSAYSQYNLVVTATFIVATALGLVIGWKIWSIFRQKDYDEPLAILATFLGGLLSWIVLGVSFQNIVEAMLPLGAIVSHISN